MTLRDLKVGDKVFVVYHRRHGHAEENASTQIITKVGSKYAYFALWRRDVRFHRESGESYHQEICDRANGLGFDVYRSEEDYRKQMFDLSEFDRLKGRLISSWGKLVELSPEVVGQIHNILDAGCGGDI